MTQDIKLPYGLRNGELVHISKVERGLSCHCICPCCKETLVARKGEHNVDHFAHHTTEACQGALETALHLAAKKILEESKSIVLPPVKVDLGLDFFPIETIINVFPFEEHDPDYEEGKFLKYRGDGEWERVRAPDRFHRYHVDYSCSDLCITSKSLSSERKYTIDKAVLEQRISSITPDLVVEIKKIPLFIEIYVTHRIDNSKLEKIKGLGISTIEIDLSELDGDLRYDAIEKILIGTSKHKRWIYNKKVEMYREQLLQAVEIKETTFKKSKRNKQILCVENCPINKRDWFGMSYANVRHDCWDCEYQLDILTRYEEFDDIEEIVVCGGKRRIKAVNELWQSIGLGEESRTIE